MDTETLNEAFLISPKFIRQYSIINKNISDDYLKEAIREASEFDLQPILGESLYKYATNLVLTGKITSSENKAYYNLAIKCRYFLLYNVMSRLIVDCYAKISNSGVTTNKDETYESLSLTDALRLKQEYSNKADFYTKQVQYYILNNSSSFPELDSDVAFSLKSQLKSSAKCNIFLGGARGKRKIPTELRDDKYIVINK
jgi:hypothetical protein